MHCKIQCTLHRKVFRTMHCVKYKIPCTVQYTVFNKIYSVEYKEKS